MPTTPTLPPTPWTSDLIDGTLYDRDGNVLAYAAARTQAFVGDFLPLLAAAPQLVEALRNLYALVDDGTLVRDISRDGEPDYARRVVRLCEVLINANQALTLAGSREGKGG